MRLTALALLLLTTGCAQFMAAGQPPDIRSDKVRLGASRIAVVNAVGPASTSKHREDGTLKEFYTFTDGQVINRPGFKALRIVVYTAGDIFFLFLTQVVWMPIELFLAGEQETIAVTYENVNDDWVVMGIRDATSYVVME